MAESTASLDAGKESGRSGNDQSRVAGEGGHHRSSAAGGAGHRLDRDSGLRSEVYNGVVFVAKKEILVQRMSPAF